MKPITRKEYYLAKAAGTYTGPTPPPVLREDYYLATLSGDYSGHCPAPVTRIEKYMSAAAGLTTYVPQPVTRIEKYWYAITKDTGYVPEPVTREEKFLYAILKNPPKPEYLDKTAEGNPILLTDSAEAPLTALTLYGWSKQDGTPTPENPVPIVSAGKYNEDAQKWEYEINIAGKNLFNKELFIEKALETGKFERVMKDGRDCLYINNSSWSDRTLNLMLFNPGVDMTLSYDAYLNAELIGVSSQGFCSQHKNGSTRYYLLGSSDALYKWNSKKYAVNGDIISLCVTYGTDSSVYFDLDSIQLEIGNVKTAYEEPKPLQTLTVQTPGGLPGIPVSSDGNYTDESGQQWICDEIDLKRGKHVQRVSKVVVDGANLKFKDINNGFWNLPDFTAPGLTQAVGAPYSSNYFPEYTFEGNFLYDYIYTRDKNINPYFSSDDELNAFCAEKYTDGQPLEIYYPIDPIETDLPAEEIAAYKALHTYSPTTTVSNDAGAWMKVGYRATL